MLVRQNVQQVNKMGESILNRTNPITVNGENTATKHRPMDGSKELMDAIFPMPKNDPKLNNNYNVDLISLNILIHLWLQSKVTYKKECMPPLSP